MRRRLSAKTVVLAVAILLFIGSLLFFMSKYEDHKLALNEMQKTLASSPVPTAAPTDQSGVQATPVPTDVAPAEVIRSNIELAQEAIDSVTGLQNEYADLIMNWTGMDGSGEIDKMGELTDSLKQYFGASSSLCSNWCIWDRGCSDVKWIGMPALDYVGYSVPAVWLCVDGNGRVLTYVTADYNAASNTFSNGMKYVTSVGVSMAPVEDETPYTTVSPDELDDFIYSFYRILQRAGISPSDLGKGGGD